MAVKKNNSYTFYSYYYKVIQLFVAGKPIPKEMLIYIYDGRTVAHRLASWHPSWITNDKEILVLRDASTNTVAHYLAFWHPSWVTNDLEILYLKNNKNRTVKEILVERIMAGKKKDGS